MIARRLAGIVIVVDEPCSERQRVLIVLGGVERTTAAYFHAHRVELQEAIKALVGVGRCGLAPEERRCVLGVVVHDLAAGADRLAHLAVCAADGVVDLDVAGGVARGEARLVVGGVHVGVSQRVQRREVDIQGLVGAGGDAELEAAVDLGDELR